jgi:N-acylneuraminate cytidylyltransferase
MLPLLPFSNNGTPWHSSQYPALPEVFAQNASLEFAWTSIVLHHNTISGEAIIPFVTTGFEGFDINIPADILLAEYCLVQGEAQLPEINCPPYLMQS